MKPTRIPHGYREDEQIALTRKNVPLQEQSKRLNICIRTLYTRYRHHLARGIVEKLQEQKRPWTRDETRQLIVLLQAGYSHAEIGKLINRTKPAVSHHIKENRIRVTHTTRLMSAIEIAHLLGFAHASTATNWIRKDLLIARNAGTATRPLWRITHADFYDFLRDESCWMLWSPDSITNDRLRRWSTDLRRGHPQWLSTNAVAAHCHASILSVSRWIRDGRLPATRHGLQWYVRETDLDGFVIPCERDRRAA